MIFGAKILFCVISILSVLVLLSLTLVLVTQHSTKPSILASPATTASASAAAPSRLPSGKTEGYKYVLYWNEAYGTKGGHWTRTLCLQM